LELVQIPVDEKEGQCLKSSKTQWSVQAIGEKKEALVRNVVHRRLPESQTRPENYTSAALRSLRNATSRVAAAISNTN
jgi:hypothetical protein